MPRINYTAEQRADWQRHRIAEESSRLYGGNTWDGKFWRDPNGRRIRPLPSKSNPFTDGTLSVRAKIVGNRILVTWGNVVQLFNRFRRERDGVAAIEFAMVAPVLILMIAVSITLGMMTMAKQAVMFATQQAAVVQSTGGTPATIFAANVANTPGSNATVACNTSGNVATCTGTAQFPNMFAGVLGIGPTTPLTYSASVQVPQ